MITLSVLDNSISNDLEDIIRLFYPGYGLGFSDSVPDMSVEVRSGRQAGQIWCEVYFDGTKICEDRIPDEGMQNELIFKRFYKRLAKNTLYLALKGRTGLDMPWGSLTGIRPTRPARELANKENGGIFDQRMMTEEFFLSPNKSELLGRIINAQTGYLFDNSYVNMYINLPFCATKCNYCSFPSDTVKRAQKHFDRYSDCLKAEISHAYKIAKEAGKKILSVYIGGGTPTSVPDGMLKEILMSVTDRGREFTLEAGRADSISRSKLDLAKDFGVSRVCINPQTFKDATLQAIGRNHTVSDFYFSFKLAKSYGFDINCDLIAGLSGESYGDFEDSVTKAVMLEPDNITVHSLSVKSGSIIKEQKAELSGADIGAMTDFSARALTAAGYIPYYVYRQKYTLGNGENTGWSKPGKQCINNISVMEEANTVIACGCGAISKFVHASGGRIERHANAKDMDTYFKNFDSSLSNKELLLKNSLH